MTSVYRIVTLLVYGLAVGVRGASLPELFQERLQSVVAVEFFVQDEIERHPVGVQGTVIDDQGTIILPAASIQPTLAADQLKDFKVYRPGSSVGVAAGYLGQDAFTGWHYVRVEKDFLAAARPITVYPTVATSPGVSDELWGIGLRGKDEDFMPYFLSSRVALVTQLPQKTAILGHEVAGPGLPVFNLAGEFAGLAQPSFGQNFLLFSRAQNSEGVLLVNVEESSVVWLAEEVLPYLKRVPQSVHGRPIAWLGAYGLQPLDPEVAKLLQLENQSGVVLSDIMEGSPAAAAGLQERDIVLAIDGRPFPRLKPDHILPSYFGQEILRRQPGEVITLTVSHEGVRRDCRVTLGDEPKLPREAARRYFARLGFTVREFLVNDSIAQRIRPDDWSGVVVRFVKPGSPVATAGLWADDWVREIDGHEIRTYAQAVEQLEKIDRDNGRAEFIILVSRGGETAVLRVKLH